LSLNAKRRHELLTQRDSARAAGDVSGARALDSEYAAGLPRPRLTRCPFTTTEVAHSIDTFDIDGPWWDYDFAVRPTDDLPDTFFAFTGAIHFDGKPAVTEFLCKPGPGAPFVVPRLLARPEIVAVISHLKVGKNDAYPVFYFSQPMARDEPRFNTWGMNQAWFKDAEGRWAWDHNEEDFEALDFDLAPWVERGKLRWIQPGDRKLALRDDLKGFPYAGIDGPRTFVRVQYGEIREPVLPSAR
jgi:hypothetical protein